MYCRAHATAFHHGVVLAPGSIKFKCSVVRCAPSIFLVGGFNFLDQRKVSAGCPGIQSSFDEGFCFSVGFFVAHILQDTGGKDEGLLGVASSFADVTQELGVREGELVFDGS